MQLLSNTVILAALLVQGVVSTAVPNEVVRDAVEGTGLHVDLGGFAQEQTIGAFLSAPGISARETNPELHNMLLSSSPSESVGNFVKRTCPGGNGNRCCPNGSFLVL
ncbi:Hypothetical protein D9617_3g018690 [Elsinoe fawcettii]|nr:Hypothetical protein D9617_3g018690 [Elsinoe fawcettii]